MTENKRPRSDSRRIGAGLRGRREKMAVRHVPPWKRLIVHQQIALRGELDERTGVLI